MIRPHHLEGWGFGVDEFAFNHAGWWLGWQEVGGLVFVDAAEW